MKKIGYNLMYKLSVCNIFLVGIFDVKILLSVPLSPQCTAHVIASYVTLGTACRSQLRQQQNNIELESRADRQEMIY